MGCSTVLVGNVPLSGVPASEAAESAPDDMINGMACPVPVVAISICTFRHDRLTVNLQSTYSQWHLLEAC
jgi:hypothetical protein